MKYLLEIADAVATKKEDKKINEIKQAHKGEIEEEVTKASDKDVDEILARLFPAGIPISTDFYNTLQMFQHHIGYGSAFYVLGGRIWARGCSEFAPDEQKALLDALFDENGRGVWRSIHYFPEFCSRVEIESQFAAGWFYRFGNEVKNDMLSWYFFDGVTNYAAHFPVSGMKVFEIYISEQLDEQKIWLAALLLGTVRSKAAQGHYEKAIVNHWDKNLSINTQIEMRLVYYKSLPTSFDMGNLSTQELDSELTKMLKGEHEEISEAFSIIWRCLRSERADENFVKFAMNWFSQNVSSKLPDAAKYHLVNALWF